MTSELTGIGRVIRIGSKPGLQPRSPTLPANLRPIDAKALAVKLADTLSLWKTPDTWSAAQADWYREALADLPADLVDLALKHARTHYKFFPKPAELREPVRGIWDQRQRFHADRVKRQADIAEQLRERAEWLERERQRKAEAAALSAAEGATG